MPSADSDLVHEIQCMGRKGTYESNLVGAVVPHYPRLTLCNAGYP